MGREATGHMWAPYAQTCWGCCLCAQSLPWSSGQHSSHPEWKHVRVRQRCQDPESTGWVHPRRLTKRLRGGAELPRSAPVAEVYTAPSAHTEEVEK